MQELADFKEKIHSCSKCGLCQAVCPIYKITGNDCTVSRGQFIMLYAMLKGKFEMSENINKYLDLCLKCGACSKFCPSGIDVVEIIAHAKAEYFKKHRKEKIISYIQRKLMFGLITNIANIFSKKIKSKSFTKKVIYFGGCGSKINGNVAIIKLLNACNIEVITPNFECCGIPLYVRGDLKSFEQYKKSFINIVNQYDVKDIVTTCASCEKTIKSYNIENLNIKNIFEYIKDCNLHLALKNKEKVTFHKPCNLNNYETITQLLSDIENLEYTEMNDYDACCGLNLLSKPTEYKIIKKLLCEKHNNIISSGAKTVLTSCLGCENVLKLGSGHKYKVEDLTAFLAKNIKNGI